MSPQMRWSECRRSVARHSDFRALDRQRFQICDRIIRIEDLAVEEGLLAAAVTLGSVTETESLCGLEPEIAAVRFGHQGLGIDGRFELAPADVLGDEPGVEALPGVGDVAVIAPEFHQQIGALLDATAPIIDVAFDAADDV